MVMETIMQQTTLAAAGALALAALAEWIHARRVTRLGRLAFGPDARPRAWTRMVPPLRVAALAGVVWALAVLLAMDGSSRLKDRSAAATRHLMVLLDVSPSMEVADAGPDGSQTRRARAANVLKSVMDRAGSEQVRVSMACFYSDAMMLVKECSDRELIWHFANNLPLHIAYRPGKTSLLTSLNTAGNFVKDFPHKSVTLLVLTDGDTVPATGLRRLPSSVAQLIIAGVGNPGRGTFLDGHQSRQDSASLAQLARRLGGQYHDANVKQIPSGLLTPLTAPDRRSDGFQLSLRMLAVFALVAGSVVLCLLPLLLEAFGSAWKPPVRAAEPEVQG
jgi:Ca-activated chloride channel homolog